MTNNPLKGKRIALLGGMGARPEARRTLIDELELAELEWVYSERNKSKEYQAFVEAYYPGKYDYIFLLVKFISHKVIDLLKSVDLGETKLIRIKGSYNPEGFLNAMFEQAESQTVEEDVEEAPQVVTRKLLEPAKAHEGPVPVAHEPTNDHNQELLQWQKTFGATTPEKAKANVDKKIAALEARVAQLSANQQDQKLLDAAHQYHLAVEEFLEKMPTPTEFTKANDRLVTLLKKHGVPITKDKNKPKQKEDVRITAMRTNILLSKLFHDVVFLAEILIENTPYDRHGACVSCKVHKSIGCDPTCIRSLLRDRVEFINKAVNVAKKPGFMDFVSGALSG